MPRSVRRLKNSFGKFVRGKGFAAIFLLVAIAAVFYVSDRIGRLSRALFDVNAAPVMCIVMFVFMAYMMLYIKSDKVKNTRALYECCSVALCFFLHTMLTLLVFDAVMVALRMRRDVLYLIPIAAALVITVYGFLHARHIYVKRYDVPLRGVPAPMRIALLSDVHAGTFVGVKQLGRIVDAVNAAHADAVIFAGDMFDVDAFDHCDTHAVAEVLRRLEPKGSVYAALGNHDPKSSETKIRRFFSEANIDLLIDDVRNAQGLSIIGRNDSMNAPGRRPLADLLTKVGGDAPRIVIDHNPTGIAECVSNGVELVLCGHTHKGQFFPANIFTYLAYGKQGFYGHSREGDTQSVVSSGIGYFQMPMRTCSNSELVVLDIH